MTVVVIVVTQIVVVKAKRRIEELETLLRISEATEDDIEGSNFSYDGSPSEALRRKLTLNPLTPSWNPSTVISNNNNTNSGGKRSGIQPTEIPNSNNVRNHWNTKPTVGLNLWQKGYWLVLFLLRCSLEQDTDKRNLNLLFNANNNEAAENYSYSATSFQIGITPHVDCRVDPTSDLCYSEELNAAPYESWLSLQNTCLSFSYRSGVTRKGERFVIFVSTSKF